MGLLTIRIEKENEKKKGQIGSKGIQYLKIKSPYNKNVIAFKRTTKHDP